MMDISPLFGSLNPFKNNMVDSAGESRQDFCTGFGGSVGTFFKFKIKPKTFFQKHTFYPKMGIQADPESSPFEYFMFYPVRSAKGT